MGLEIGVILAGVSAVVGAVGTIASVNASRQSAEAQTKARDVTAAQNKIEGQNSRRQRIREERIRRAQILAASENSGTSASSGELGAIGALRTNLNDLISTASGQSKANDAVNRWTQRAVDFDNQATMIGTITTGIRQGLGDFTTAFDRAAQRPGS